MSSAASSPLPLSLFEEFDRLEKQVPKPPPPPPPPEQAVELAVEPPPPPPPPVVVAQLQRPPMTVLSSSSSSSSGQEEPRQFHENDDDDEDQDEDQVAIIKASSSSSSVAAAAAAVQATPVRRGPPRKKRGMQARGALQAAAAASSAVKKPRLGFTAAAKMFKSGFPGLDEVAPLVMAAVLDVSDDFEQARINHHTIAVYDELSVAAMGQPDDLPTVDELSGNIQQFVLARLLEERSDNDQAFFASIQESRELAVASQAAAPPPPPPPLNGDQEADNGVHSSADEVEEEPPRPPNAMTFSMAELAAADVEQWMQPTTFARFSSDHAIDFLGNLFRRTPRGTIGDVVRKYRGNYLPSFLALQALHAAKRETLKKPRPFWQPLESVDRELQLQMAYAANYAALKQMRDDEEMARQLIGQDGGTLECLVCCREDLLAHEMVQCSEGHLNCVDCCRKHATNLVYEGRAAVKCTTVGCASEYPRRELERVLPSAVLERLDANLADNNLRGSNIKNLRSCARCPYKAAVEDEALVELVCPKCKTTTCLKCDREAHRGKTCADVDKSDAITMLRRFIEDAASNARITNCPGKSVECGVPLTKANGCNHLKCTKCGADVCHVCKIRIQGSVREHFGKKKCPQFNKNDERFEAKRARAAAEAALKLYLQKHPEVRGLAHDDPLASVPAVEESVDDEDDDDDNGDMDNGAAKIPTRNQQGRLASLEPPTPEQD